MKATAKLNTYHLKEWIVHQVPSLEYFNMGRDVYLVFREDVGNMLQKRHKEDLDDEGMHLAKAAAIIRKDILGSKYSFNGLFDENCQARSVPQSFFSENDFTWTKHQRPSRECFKGPGSSYDCTVSPIQHLRPSS